MLLATNPEKSQSKVIGTIVENDSLAALDAARKQLTFIREWMLPAMEDSIRELQDQMQGIAATCETIEPVLDHHAKEHHK